MWAVYNIIGVASTLVILVKEVNDALVFKANLFLVKFIDVKIYLNSTA